jgi:hypothetical protein
MFCWKWGSRFQKLISISILLGSFTNHVLLLYPDRYPDNCLPCHLDHLPRLIPVQFLPQNLLNKHAYENLMLQILGWHVAIFSLTAATYPHTSAWPTTRQQAVVTSFKQLLNVLNDIITASFTPQHDFTDDFRELHEGSTQLPHLYSLKTRRLIMYMTDTRLFWKQKLTASTKVKFLLHR